MYIVWGRWGHFYKKFSTQKFVIQKFHNEPLQEVGKISVPTKVNQTLIIYFTDSLYIQPIGLFLNFNSTLTLNEVAYSVIYV